MHVSAVYCDFIFALFKSTARTNCLPNFQLEATSSSAFYTTIKEKNELTFSCSEHPTMPSRYYTASGTDSLKWIRDKPPQFSSDPAYIEVQDGQVFLDIIEGDLPFFGESTHGRSLAQTLFGQPIPSSKPRVIKDSAFHIDYSNRNQADHDHIMAERAHHVASSATSRYEEGAKEISVQS